jgi:hypothetical protein
MDPKKGDLIRNYLRPKNASELRSFYGLLVTYYRDFLPGLSSKSTILTDLLKKENKFRQRTPDQWAAWAQRQREEEKAERERATSPVINQQIIGLTMEQFTGLD